MGLASERADEVRTVISVEGMTCAACSGRVASALQAVDAVSDASVNFASGRAAVVHDGSVDEASLRRAVERAGYSSPVRDGDSPGATRNGDSPAGPTASRSGRDGARQAEERGDGDEYERAETRRLGDLRVLRRRLAAGAAAGVPVVAVSMLPQLRFNGWHWFASAAAAFVVFGTGWRFHRAAVRNLRHGAVTMDTLVSLGTVTAWAWSSGVLLFDVEDGHVYFETGVVIAVLVLLGKWLEARAIHRSGDALRRLARLGVARVRLVGGAEVDAGDLEVGMRFIVRPGERIAVDGVVVDGVSAVDASTVTGEPVPVDVAPGDEVTGATLNTYGTMVVEAVRVGADTVLAQIVRLVEQAQGGRAAVQRLVDRVSSVFVPVVIVTAVVVLGARLALGAVPGDAVAAAIAVLIVSCPCALGLATPLAVMVGTGRAAQLGVIIKGAEVLERARDIDAVVLDKTGTVTEGRLEVVEAVMPCVPALRVSEPSGEAGRLVGGVDRAAADTVIDGDAMAELGSLIGALESRSEHPVGVAVARRWRSERGITDFRNRPGVGVVGRVDGVEARVGRRSLFQDVPEPVETAAAAFEARGLTTVLAGRGAAAEAVIAMADTVKPSSVEAVSALRSMGLHVTLLTGDNVRIARSVGADIAVDDVIADVLPAEKAAEVSRLQAEGRRVAMVGDGINDAPALAQADLAIALGAGADVAVEVSDITVVGGDLRAVPDALAVAGRTLATIRWNLFWAFAYNTAAIPLAVGGVLSPMVAAAAMTVSSLFVVSNSLRLRRVRTIRPPVSPDPPGRSSRPVGVPPKSSESVFSLAMVVSGVRCLLAYVVFPWVLPAAGVVGGVGSGLGLVIGVIAMVFNVVSIRRFWRVGHRYRWAVAVINGGVMVLLAVMVVGDLTSLLR